MSMPRPSYRIFRAAWIMARAFTPHVILAPLALPWTLLSILPGTVRGGLYLDPTRTGMVMLYRSRMLLDVTLLLPIMLIAGGMLGLLLNVLAMLAPSDSAFMLLALIVAVLGIGGLLFLLPRSGGSMLPWGAETPAGQRWEVAGLSQLPGTRLTGIQLALRVIRDVPPSGAVIVATANSEKLTEQYRKFGFTVGPRHRVHRLVG